MIDVQFLSYFLIISNIANQQRLLQFITLMLHSFFYNTWISFIYLEMGRISEPLSGPSVSSKPPLA